MADSDIKLYQLGSFPLASGLNLPRAFIAYKTFGSPSNPAIIYPTWFSGLISDNEWLVGTDKALNPEKYFIIIPALFGNGQSSSPTNMPHLRKDIPFPDITIRDNVTAQYKLVTEELGVKHARLVLGWSLGAAQTYQWLTQYPDFADLGVPFCGSAKTSLHNQTFLEGIKSALLAAKGAASGGIGAREVSDGGYRNWTAAEKETALKALARVYAGWGLSQAFYRKKIHERLLGYESLDEFLIEFWEKWALSKDPENLLVQLHTWQAGDISEQDPFHGDFEKAINTIKAKTLVIPSKTDLYFPPEDSELEVELMRPGVGKVLPFNSIWGHW
ncbi:hypothetical protein SLS53_001708 [Cytospora paraplurivora]|uniref:AB hydrolase-1 domain-containing protein n=1 Tax=Cytospora paraplurivora TaxID=2898453 RepID=A0AAN9YJK3_9PEZI